MRTVFLSIVSLSFGIIPLLLLLFVLRKQIKKRFGAGWVRLIWIAVLLRLLIPCSFTGVSLLSPNLFAANPMSAAVGAEAGSILAERFSAGLAGNCVGAGGSVVIAVSCAGLRLVSAPFAALEPRAAGAVPAGNSGRRAKVLESARIVKNSDLLRNENSGFGRCFQASHCAAHGAV